MGRLRREGFELSEEPDEGGAAPGSGTPGAADGALRIRGAAPSEAGPPAPLAADPLHVGEDSEPLPTRPVVFLLDDIARSMDPSVCPFLRRDLHGTLVAPASVPGAEQTCIAVGAPRPQPLRQQELVCLRDAHANCPRYLRGAADVSSPAGRGIPEIPKATVAALLILVLSAALSFAFVVQRGGIAMPVLNGSPSPIAVVTTPTPAVPGATPAPVQTGAPASLGVPTSPSPSASASPASSVAPSPVATPTPIPTPSPTPTATPARPASPNPTATPTSTRYKLLKPCPDRKDCYIYVVRSGDNLFSIANYFGHSLATIYRLNPQYPETRLRAGDRIRMPAPTR